MKKQINKKKVGLIAGGIILLTVLYFIFDHRVEKPVEYPFTICQGEYCIQGKQVGKVDDCVVTERQERICGPYILRIDPKIQVNVQQ